MAYIVQTLNPFKPADVQIFEHPGGISIREWLEQQFPGFKEFDRPTICMVNGQPVLRKDWTRNIEAKDVVNFIALQGDPVTILIVSVVLVVATVVLSLTVLKPSVPGEQKASDPVYSLDAQRNAIRLGEPIEVCYGRNRIFPSYATRPYFVYIDNEQYLHSLFCLGQGEFEVHQILVGETDVANFQEVQYEIIPPGDTISLFSPSVYTSSEAGGQTLFAPNEPEYPSGDGWIGPFAVCPPGYRVTKYEFDIIWPRGLYKLSNKGGVKSMSTSIQVQVREWINDIQYVDFSPETITFSAATTTPQRKTYTRSNINVARYELRFRRVDEKDMSTRSGHEVVLEGVRGYLDLQPDFGNVTLLAIRARASNNLNDRSQQQFSVIATRKLQVLQSDGTFSTDLVPTRSIVAAFADVFRSNYGARLADQFLDIERLLQLEDIYESRNEHFDWIFRDPITVWEAAQTIATVGRAVPLLQASTVSLKRDAPLTVPVAMFNSDNIIKDSFEWEVKLWEPQDHDSVAIEYIEPATGYREETVTVALPGGTTDNPKTVKVAGVTDRNHAFRMGLFLLAQERYLRENVSFETGMEGFLPSFGDLILVSHDVPKWGAGGYVVHAVQHSVTDWTLWLSQPVEFSESSAQHVIWLRNKQGRPMGPFAAYQTDDPKQINVRLTVIESDFLLGGINEPMLFLFGVLGQETKYLKVTSIEPSAGERVKITGVVDNPIVHSFDDLTAPPLEVPLFVVNTPDVPPAVTGIRVSFVDTTQLVVMISWLPIPSATYYVVQMSVDNSSWFAPVTTNRPYLRLQVPAGDIWIRVAAVRNGLGPWTTYSFSTGWLRFLEVVKVWDNQISWSVGWRNLISAAYRVRVYDHSGSVPVLKRTEDIVTTTYTYDINKAIADGNVTRDMRVSVIPLFENETNGQLEEADQPPVFVDLHNNVPSSATNLGHEFLYEESAPEPEYVYYRLFWTVPHEDDLHKLQLWYYNAPMNAPHPQDFLITEITFSEIGWQYAPTEYIWQVPVTIEPNPPGYMVHHATKTWYVVLLDVWGNEVAPNLEQNEVPEYRRNL